MNIPGKVNWKGYTISDKSSNISRYHGGKYILLFDFHLKYFYVKYEITYSTGVFQYGLNNRDMLIDYNITLNHFPLYYVQVY